MAKIAQCFADNSGHFHTSPEAATVADIAVALGQGGDSKGMSPGLAQLILKKRVEIEMAFVDYDLMRKGIAS